MAAVEDAAWGGRRHERESALGDQQASQAASGPNMGTFPAAFGELWDPGRVQDDESVSARGRSCASPLPEGFGAGVAVGR
ncbi:Nn.00g037310.m01.CDS01 [Neocucurbitaria sp. VM-36]